MIPFYQIDTFTTLPFHGNTAGVVLSEVEIPHAQMQNIATQNNLPATAFVSTGADQYQIRWFTPANELPLCGHGSLAAAFVLFSSGGVLRELIFKSKGGDLAVRQKKEWIEMDFPAFDHQEEPMLPADLYALFNKSLVAASVTQNRLLVELSNEQEVREFRPDASVLKNHRLILTAKAKQSSDYDFVSRYFAYPDGVAEDAVTGSSHCSLVPYWSEKLHKHDLFALQVSPRGGELKLKRTEKGVTIAGRAVKVMEGHIYLSL